jgi:DegV family protein with EDD domain
MRPVRIVTDSTADIARKTMTERDISMVPLYVRFGETVYRDGIDIDTTDLYRMVEEKGELPTTSSVSPGDFIKAFAPFVERGEDVIFIGIGDKLSATFKSAMLAASEFEEGRVVPIDSKNLSSGTALLVLKACDLRDKGFDAKAIRDAITDMVPRVRSQFAIRTLDYLHKGGRASGTAKLVGTVLGIKPIIKVNDGTLLVHRKPAGKMSRALDIMLGEFLAEGENIDTERVMITHSQAEKNVGYMADVVKESVDVKDLVISDAGCVISSHCGPGTIGILYVVKST